MMQIQEHILLRDHTTLRIGGPARYFAVVRDDVELREALQWARSKNISYFILGGGSNLVVADTGYPGLVIKPQFIALSFRGGIVTAGASIVLSDLIDRSLSEGLVGMEFAAGIPGTVGGAVRGNAGTYGVSMSDALMSVTFVHEQTRATTTYTREECVFAYRHSIFKSYNHVIMSCVMALHTGDTAESRRIIDKRIAIRRERHPLEPSAGCIFKNVEFSKVDLDDLSRKGVATERFKEYKKIPSGFLIELLGLKGKAIGGAQISEKHANYIINTGTATFEDVISLIGLIKQRVRDAYSVQLEEEAQILA